MEERLKIEIRNSANVVQAGIQNPRRNTIQGSGAGAIASEPRVGMCSLPAIIQMPTCSHPNFSKKLVYIHVHLSTKCSLASCPCHEHSQRVAALTKIAKSLPYSTALMLLLTPIPPGNTFLSCLPWQLTLLIVKVVYFLIKEPLFFHLPLETECFLGLLLFSIYKFSLDIKIHSHNFNYHSNYSNYCFFFFPACIFIFFLVPLENSSLTRLT